MLATRYNSTGATTFRLPQFRPATISATTMAPIAAMNAQSTTITRTGPCPNAPATASRPASHKAASTISGQPRVGIRPVQFGMAVNKNPAMTAEV